MDTIIKQAIFANGCFWCTEAVFQRLEGVVNVVSGYTGGHIKNPAYREVCNGTTGHAEAIRIDFDPKVISYQTLLEVFFATHDPTTLNRQGNDVGTQYRSAIFYGDETQKNEAKDFIDTLTKAVVFKESIVTQLQPLDIFYLAEHLIIIITTKTKSKHIVILPLHLKLKKYSNFLQINLNQINE